VEKANESRAEFKLSRPSTCNSCLMQFESSTYFHEVCYVVHICHISLLIRDKASCVRQNEATQESKPKKHTTQIDAE
jgi:hypothetical protein